MSPLRTRRYSISIADFHFKNFGAEYYVMYSSPATGQRWHSMIGNMNLINATHKSEHPKKKDLLLLKVLCKLQNIH